MRERLAFEDGEPEWCKASPPTFRDELAAMVSPEPPRPLAFERDIAHLVRRVTGWHLAGQQERADDAVKLARLRYRFPVPAFLRLRGHLLSPPRPQH
jgi:hypothetical protein